MIQWMSNLFTVQYGPYFMAGFIVAWGWHFLKSIARHKPKVRIKWNSLIIVLAILTFLWVAVTTQQNANCVHEFNRVIRIRAQISEDNDRWSREQRTAIAQWLAEILSPPPDIAALRAEDPGNPKVTKWAFAITTKYSDIIQNAQHEQDKNLEERKSHPLPESSCRQ
jgi:hypothetical protein